MFKFSSIYINVLSFFISVIIFIFTQVFFTNYDAFLYKSSLKAGFEVENVVQDTKEQVNNTNEMIKEKITEDLGVWHLEIPKINLKASISEGTTKEVMEDYIGHFEETTKENGNVGLAAHNRGYKNNYFQRIKELKEGDSIFYTYNGETKEYLVINHVIIKDTDWTYLEDTDKNTITLITCVENEPEYRRCIQGEEKIESGV